MARQLSSSALVLVLALFLIAATCNVKATVVSAAGPGDTTPKSDTQTKPKAQKKKTKPSTPSVENGAGANPTTKPTDAATAPKDSAQATTVDQSNTEEAKASVDTIDIEAKLDSAMSHHRREVEQMRKGSKDLLADVRTLHDKMIRGNAKGGVKRSAAEEAQDAAAAASIDGLLDPFTREHDAAHEKLMKAAIESLHAIGVDGAHMPSLADTKKHGHAAGPAGVATASVLGDAWNNMPDSGFPAWDPVPSAPPNSAQPNNADL